MRRLAAIVPGAVALIAVIAVGVAAAAAGEMSTSVHFGPQRLSIGQHWTGPTPPPAERELQIELDRNLTIRAKGAPTCGTSPSLQTGLTIQEACAGAQVGFGEETIEVAFPEGAPIEVPGRVQIYNGGERKGAITLYVQGTFSAPIKGALLAKVVITRIHNGQLGWLVDAKFPEVADGSGSISDLDLKLTRPGVFSTRCVDGKLEAAVRVGFEDGTTEESEVAQRCGIRTVGKPSLAS